MSSSGWGQTIRAQRDKGKTLVREVVRDVNVRLEHELQRVLEIQRERGPEIDRGWEHGIGR